MLTLYRRHLKSCEHRSEGRAYRRCRCPIWVDGFIGQQEIRESLELRDWQKANEKIQGWEAKGKKEVAPAGPVTIEQATKSFLADAAARELREPTLYKYRLLFRHCEEFAHERGLCNINEFDLEELRTFRARWRDHNLAALKKLERLRSFFTFCPGFRLDCRQSRTPAQKP